MEITLFTAALIVTGATTVTLALAYVLLRIGAACDGRDW